MAPLRILGLPGHAQSAAQLRGRLAKHLDIWGEGYELVAVNPVEPMLPTTVVGDSDYDAFETTNYRWWSWSSHFKFVPGELERALTYLRKVWEAEGPFDAIFGFSQGAAFAVLVLALLENPSLHPVWSRPSSRADVEWPPRPLRCAILCSAFGPLDPKYQPWFEEIRPATPTLHLLGRNDPVLEGVYALDTAARFGHAELYWHTGGHHIPRKAYWAALMGDFMARHCGMQPCTTRLSFAELSSPTESVASSVEEIGDFFPLSTVSDGEEEDWEYVYD